MLVDKTKQWRIENASRRSLKAIAAKSASSPIASFSEALLWRILVETKGVL